MVEFLNIRDYVITLTISSLVTLTAVSTLYITPQNSFSQESVDQAASEEINKSVVTEFLNEVFNNHNISAVDEYYADDFVSDELWGNDIETHKTAYARIIQAIPDLRVVIDDLVAEGDMVAVFTTYNGTFQGNLSDSIVAKSEPVTIEIADLFKLSNGSITEHSGVSDYTDLNVLSLIY